MKRIAPAVALIAATGLTAASATGNAESVPGWAAELMPAPERRPAASLLFTGWMRAHPIPCG